MSRYLKLIISIGIASVFLLLPVSTSAAVGLPFGGIAAFPLPCTCTGTVAIWFAPLYLGGPIAITGPLVYSPYSTIPFANYMTGVPGVWHLGSYLPGVQACWMFGGITCFPFPTIGLMTKVGTGRLF